MYIYIKIRFHYSIINSFFVQLSNLHCIFYLNKQKFVRRFLGGSSQQHDQDARYDATSCDAMRHYVT